jgi:hypothetical protein
MLVRSNTNRATSFSKVRSQHTGGASNRELQLFTACLLARLYVKEVAISGKERDRNRDKEPLQRPGHVPFSLQTSFRPTAATPRTR